MGLSECFFVDLALNMNLDDCEGCATAVGLIKFGMKLHVDEF